MVQAKIRWPQSAVKSLLDLVDNYYKGKEGRLHKGDSTVFDELVQTLRQNYAETPNFGEILDAPQVESKLKAIWNTYKRQEQKKSQAIAPFYIQGTLALDREKLKRYLGIILIPQRRESHAGVGKESGRERGGQEQQEQGNGSGEGGEQAEEQGNQDGEGRKGDNDGADNFHNNEREVWLDDEGPRQSGRLSESERDEESEQDLSDANPSKRRRILQEKAKRALDGPKYRARRRNPGRDMRVRRSITPEPTISDIHKWKERMLSHLRGTVESICRVYEIPEIQPAYLSADLQYPEPLKIFLASLFECHHDDIHHQWSKLLQHETINQHCLIHAVLGLALTHWCFTPTIERKEYFKDLKNEIVDRHFERLYGPDAYISNMAILDPKHVLPILFEKAESDAERMADEMQQYLPLFIPDVGVAVKFQMEYKQVWKLPMREGDAPEALACRWADVSKPHPTAQGKVHGALWGLFKEGLKWRYETYVVNSKEYEFTFPVFREPYFNLNHLRYMEKRGNDDFPHNHVLLGQWPVIREKIRKPHEGWGPWESMCTGTAIMMPDTTKDIPPRPETSESEDDD